MRVFEDHERPTGVCYDCRQPYAEVGDLAIPDELWEKINPTRHPGAGILCPTCISKRLGSIGHFSGVACTLYPGGAA